MAMIKLINCLCRCIAWYKKMSFIQILSTHPQVVTYCLYAFATLLTLSLFLIIQSCFRQYWRVGKYIFLTFWNLLSIICISYMLLPYIQSINHPLIQFCISNIWQSIRSFHSFASEQFNHLKQQNVFAPPTDA